MKIEHEPDSMDFGIFDGHDYGGLDLHASPHECSVPNCPGNRNRLKLELWDEMLAALERAEHLLDATVRFVDTNPVKDYEVFFDETMCDATCLADDCGTARDSCQTALAKAKELK